METTNTYKRIKLIYCLLCSTPENHEEGLSYKITNMKFTPISPDDITFNFDFIKDETTCNITVKTYKGDYIIITDYKKPQNQYRIYAHKEITDFRPINILQEVSPEEIHELLSDLESELRQSRKDFVEYKKLRNRFNNLCNNALWDISNEERLMIEGE